MTEFTLCEVDDPDEPKEALTLEEVLKLKGELDQLLERRVVPVTDKVRLLIFTVDPAIAQDCDFDIPKFNEELNKALIAAGLVDVQAFVICGMTCQVVH
jgi:hypothetical protein